MIVKPLTANVLLEIQLQASQAYFGPSVTEAYARELCAAGPAFAAVHDGRVLGAAGLLPQWEGRAIAWALLSDAAGPHMLAITRAVKRFLAMQGYGRVETWAEVHFEPAHRWLKMLGFEFEARVRAYTPQGGDACLYGRIKRRAAAGC